MVRNGANTRAFVIMPARPILYPSSSSQRRSYLVEIAQYALLVAGWTVAFLLGRELQHGFKIWRDSRNREVLHRPSED